VTSSPHPLSRRLFLALVALLPLHTVFVRVEIALKPWLVLVAAVAALDLSQERRWPWSRKVGIGTAVFLAAVLVSWPGPEAGGGFWRLFFALVAGCLLLLVTGKHGRSTEDLLTVVFWSGAAMAATAVVLAMLSNGVFGAGAIDAVNDFFLIDRVNKAAYLDSGFLALTNWHQDPGYSALWTNVWITLSIVGVGRGLVRAPRWAPPLVLGGLAAASALTYARTGWLGLGIAVGAGLFALWHEGRPALVKGLRAVGAGAVVAALILGFHVVTDPEGVGGDVAEALGFRWDNLLVLGDIQIPGGADRPDLGADDNRLAVWAEYAERFAENPIRGIGLATGWNETGFQEPHNLVLELLGESGVVGFLGFVVLIVSLGRGGGWVAGPALVVVAAASLTQTVLFEPVLWFTLGLWLASSSTRKPVEVAVGVT
jgi:O-antigen ligase